MAEADDLRIPGTGKDEECPDGPRDNWHSHALKSVLALLKNPCFGLEEIKKEVMDIEKKLDSPLSGLGEIKTEIKDIEEKLDSPHSGLGEIKREIQDIEEKLDRMVPVSGRLTTGAVVADNPASSLVVKVLNNTASTVTVTVNVYNIGTCPNPKTLSATTVLTIQSKCGRAFIFPKPPLEYEVEFVGIVPGVFAWTATRNNAQNAPLSASNFIPSNTFRHSELVPQVDP